MFDRLVWQRARRAAGPAIGVFAVMWTAVWFFVGIPCAQLGLTHGIWTDHCPTGQLRLDVEARVYDLVRGTDDGRLAVAPRARWVVGDDRFAEHHGDDLRRGVAVAAELVDHGGEAVASWGAGAFRRDRTERVAHVELPELPDGDYTLRVTAQTDFETRTVDLDVPLYTPALVHVMTDRPLYKPGQLVQFRAAVLARTDRRPLEDRPGRWTVIAPSGLEMLVERDMTGPWGIAAGSFPLDDVAENGTWSVVWQSGDDERSASFDVRRFALPRLGIEARPTEPWVGPTDRLRFEGRATYTSGAPVARGEVRARLRVVSGRWPIPLDWGEPRELRTDRSGRFTVDYGRVPLDLMDRTEVAFEVQVTEPAGETVSGAATTVLSPESLQLDAVTELGDGVVGGFNNRVYVRVATPDGRPLAGAKVEVRPPGDPDMVRTAVADASGVIAMQLDPGEPITVVDPAPPVRLRPLKANPVQLLSVSMNEGAEVDLPSRRALDRLFDAVARCGRYTLGDRSVPVGLRIGNDGRPDEVMAPPDRAGRCVRSAMRRLRLPPGPIRTLALSWRVPDSQHPSLRLEHETAYGPGIGTQLDEVALWARRCFPFGQGRDGAALARVHWSAEQTARQLDAEVEPLDVGGLPGWAWRCMRDTFVDARLAEPIEEDGIGTATVYLKVPSAQDGPPPQDLTRTAYAMQVVAWSADGDERLGEARLVMPVGELPQLRLRASPALVAPGDDVVVELLRGPDFVGRLPNRLELLNGTQPVDTAEVEDNAVTFTVPDDRTGFLTVSHEGARAVVFVRPEAPLAVSVTSDAETYRPGDPAKITVSTTAEGKAQPAAVGLSGVDATLATLVPLPGPDDLGRATVRASTDRPAFGVFDPVALALGQVEGENAAMATVLRVGTLPSDPAGDRPVSAFTDALADIDTPLTLGFYRTLEEAVRIVREWEASAPDGEMLTPQRMVGFWDRALQRLDDDEPALDGYGRRLTLTVLPLHLLLQVDPRQLTSDGTRLPEDVVNWVAFVDADGRLK